MRRILVVDDDPHVGLAIRAWLAQHGFRGAIADGGTSGLAALDNATFDLMIVDVFMPDMRGFESIRLFHQRAPTIPLIAMSRRLPRATPARPWRSSTRIKSSIS